MELYVHGVVSLSIEKAVMFIRSSWLDRIKVQEIKLSHFSFRCYGLGMKKSKNERDVFK
jgi:hypothetical protein